MHSCVSMRNWFHGGRPVSSIAALNITLENTNTVSFSGSMSSRGLLISWHTHMQWYWKVAALVEEKWSLPTMGKQERRGNSLPLWLPSSAVLCQGFFIYVPPLQSQLKAAGEIIDIEKYIQKTAINLGHRIPVKCRAASGSNTSCMGRVHSCSIDCVRHVSYWSTCFCTTMMERGENSRVPRIPENNVPNFGPAGFLR